MFETLAVLFNFQSEEPPFSVLHILYPDWPDEGVPEDTGVVREICRRVSAVPLNLGPIVVHCRYICKNSLGASHVGGMIAYCLKDHFLRPLYFLCYLFIYF